MRSFRIGVASVACVAFGIWLIGFTNRKEKSKSIAVSAPVPTSKERVGAFSNRVAPREMMATAPPQTQTAEFEVAQLKNEFDGLKALRQRFADAVNNDLPVSEYLRIIELCFAYIAQWPASIGSEWAQRLIADCYLRIGNEEQWCEAFVESVDAGTARLLLDGIKKGLDESAARNAATDSAMKVIWQEARKRVSEDRHREAILMCEVLKQRYSGTIGEGYAYLVLGCSSQARAELETARFEFQRAIDLGVRLPDAYENLASTFQLPQERAAILEKMTVEVPEADASGSVSLAELHFNIAKNNPDLANENYLEAARYCEHVIQQYPKSNFAPYAQQMLIQMAEVTNSKGEK